MKEINHFLLGIICFFGILILEIDELYFLNINLSIFCFFKLVRIFDNFYLTNFIIVMEC